MMILWLGFNLIIMVALRYKKNPKIFGFII